MSMIIPSSPGETWDDRPLIKSAPRGLYQQRSPHGTLFIQGILTNPWGKSSPPVTASPPRPGGSSYVAAPEGAVSSSCWRPRKRKGSSLWKGSSSFFNKDYIYYIYILYNVAGILLSSPSYNMQIICLSLDKIGVQGLAATVWSMGGFKSKWDDPSWGIQKVKWSMFGHDSNKP